MLRGLEVGTESNVGYLSYDSSCLPSLPSLAARRSKIGNSCLVFLPLPRNLGTGCYARLAAAGLTTGRSRLEKTGGAEGGSLAEEEMGVNVDIHTQPRLVAAL